MREYFPILLQVIIVLGFGATVLAISVLFGKAGKRNATKDMAYECGMLPQGDAQPRFSVKFYVTALLFMLFDLEIVILVPWTFIYREFLANQISILGPILFFLGVLVLGLVYEIKKGALEWER